MSGTHVSNALNLNRALLIPSIEIYETHGCVKHTTCLDLFYGALTFRYDVCNILMNS